MQIDEILPDAICVTTDRSGMRAVHNEVPMFHDASGKWIQLGDGKRVEIGLVPVSSHYEASGSLEARPGYESQVAADQSAMLLGKLNRTNTAKEIQSPPASQIAPEATDPTKLGPDAIGKPEQEVIPELDGYVGIPPDHPMSNGTIDAAEAHNPMAKSPFHREGDDVVKLRGEYPPQAPPVVDVPDDEDLVASQGLGPPAQHQPEPDPAPVIPGEVLLAKICDFIDGMPLEGCTNYDELSQLKAEIRDMRRSLP